MQKTLSKKKKKKEKKKTDTPKTKNPPNKPKDMKEPPKTQKKKTPQNPHSFNSIRHLVRQASQYFGGVGVLGGTFLSLKFMGW